MKKNLVVSIVFIFFFISGNLTAQNAGRATFNENKMELNAGSGFYSGGFPIYAFMNFEVHPDWSVGPQVNFVFYNNFHFILSGRGDYHFNSLLNLDNELDVYAGATMGIDFSYRTTFSSGIHVGGRWYWDKIWGLNVEVGGGTYFSSTIGVSMKL